MFESLELLISTVCEAVRPAERLSVSKAAEKYRYLNNPGSYVGPWNNKIAPYLVEPMDVLTSLEHTGMIFVGPARCGKSDLFFNWLGHTAICDPADMMVVHMTQNTARDWSAGDLQKMLRHSPRIGEKVLTSNTHDIRFVNGMRLLVKWPTITELSGKTIPRLWLMDHDRMPLDVDKEGAPYWLTKKRSQTFGRYGMTVAESSPGFLVDDPKWKRKGHEAPPTPGILSLYNRGDRRVWYWPCHHCGTPFEPDFNLLQYPDSADPMEAAEQVVLACPHCGGVVAHDRDDDQKTPGKHELNQKGRWLREGQDWATMQGGIRSDIASFWLKGVAAAFTDWKTLVYNYLQASAEYERTGNEESLKTTVNVDQGHPYLPKGAEADRLPEDLKARARDFGERVIPEGVRFLLASIDVQKNRFVVQVHGMGAHGDIWVIDRFEIKKSLRTDDDGDTLWVNPGAYPEDWHLLVEEVLVKSYPLADGSGRYMQMKAVSCDSGGREGVTKNAYEFWRWLRDDPDLNEKYPDLHRRFLLVKGASMKSAPRAAITYPDSDRKDRHAGARGEVPVLMINTDQIKDQVSMKLDRTDPNGGCVNYPDWLPDWFYVELTVERRTPKGWENPRAARNEAWDLLVYTEALALSRLVRIEQIDWTDPPSWAAEWSLNDFVSDSEINKRFDSQLKSGYNLSQLAENLA